MDNKTGLSKERREELSKKTSMVEISLLEQELITILRKIPFGKLSIQVQDSIPIRYEINIGKFFEGKENFDILK